MFGNFSIILVADIPICRADLESHLLFLKVVLLSRASELVGSQDVVVRSSGTFLRILIFGVELILLRVDRTSMCRLELIIV